MLDARDAEGSRNPEVEAIIAKLEKKLVFVLTKVDLVPEGEIGIIRNKLSKVAPTLAFRPQDDQFVAKLKKAFSEEVKGKMDKYDPSKTPIKVLGVIGYPYIGKETFIDKLTDMLPKPKPKQ